MTTRPNYIVVRPTKSKHVHQFITSTDLLPSGVFVFEPKRTDGKVRELRPLAHVATEKEAFVDSVCENLRSLGAVPPAPSVVQLEPSIGIIVTKLYGLGVRHLRLRQREINVTVFDPRDWQTMRPLIIEVIRQDLFPNEAVEIEDRTTLPGLTTPRGQLYTTVIPTLEQRAGDRLEIAKRKCLAAVAQDQTCHGGEGVTVYLGEEFADQGMLDAVASAMAEHELSASTQISRSCQPDGVRGPEYATVTIKPRPELRFAAAVEYLKQQCIDHLGFGSVNIRIVAAEVLAQVVKELDVHWTTEIKLEHGDPVELLIRGK